LPHAKGLEGCSLADRVVLPSLVTAKLAVYETMRARGWSKLKLAALGMPENSVRRLLDLRHRSQMWVIDAAMAKMNAEHRSAESAGERTGGATVACSRRGATVRAAGVNVCCSGVGVNAEPSRPVANDGKQSRAAFAASEGKSVAEPVEGQAVVTACFACLQPPWPPPWRAV